MEEYGLVQFQFKYPAGGKQVYFLGRQSARQIFDIMYGAYFYKYVKYKWRRLWYTDKHFNMHNVKLYDGESKDEIESVGSMEFGKRYIMETAFDIPKCEDAPCSVDCMFKTTLSVVKEHAVLLRQDNLIISWNGDVEINVGKFNTQLHFIQNEATGQVDVIGNDSIIEQSSTAL